MHRRNLLAAAGAAFFAGTLRGAELPGDVKITRAVGFNLTSRRNKTAGKNARLDVHGDRGHDRMLRIYTNQGVEGIGNCAIAKEAAAELLGKNPLDFFRPAERRVVGPFGAGTMPLWDLAGKLLKKPAYELLGGAGAEKIPAYDGSIYFADLLAQYAAGWADRFRQEIDQGLALGHGAFKIKLGRGFKWMPRAEGDRRDVEVVKLIRRHAGPDVLLGVDANNGYDLAGAKRLLDELGGEKLAFVEELFPETVEQCLELKAFIRERGWRTLVADGETQHDLTAYQPFMEARAIDVFQGDMNHFGLDGILAEAAMCKPHGGLIAPHNWGSLVGFFMELHVGRAVSNFYRAEHDPLASDVIVADGYQIKDGLASLPEAPGFGLSIDEGAFGREAEIRFDVKASK
ncbi:MAG TPA: mandelate racemase/muconate lactonizing enzyme family protein [Pirellulales bacterium]|jgi:L-alanine-DL-glutamate epimerase-like enolase superfamily enzyme|nr:mandelate racemase/muconate lactonizing enzyme family protein [Pirellulales bacterium]